MGKVDTFSSFPQAVLDALEKPFGSVCYALSLAGDPTTESSTASLLRKQLMRPLQEALGCPVGSSAVNESVERICPGYSFYGGPTGEVAPGAIMD